MTIKRGDRVTVFRTDGGLHVRTQGGLEKSVLCGSTRT